MSLSSYNIRFMLSVQNNTRNSLNRVMSDMRKMSKIERELAASQQHLNLAQREAAKESRLLQKRQADLVTGYGRQRKELRATAKAVTVQADAIRRYKDQLKGLESRERRLTASRRNAVAAMQKHSVGTTKWMSARDLAKAASIDLRRLPAQQKQLETNIRRAGVEQQRLNHLQMKQLAGLKLNKKEQLEILAAMEAQAIAQAKLALEQERLDARQARRDTLGRRVNRGRIMTDVGRNMQLRGLLLTAGLGYIADYASDFATSTAKAASQVQAPGGGTPTTKGIQANNVRLQKDILNLMGQYPAKAKEMTDASYQIFSSMNVNYKQGISLLETFNAIAVAGATDLATATDAGITLFNNFGGSAAKNARVLDTAFSIIRVGRMEFEDFNQMLNQVAPAAKAAGQSLEDVGGAMAFLTTRMPSQRMAATALARLMEGFSRSDFRSGMQKLGKSIEDEFHNLLPLPEIMKQVYSLPMAQSKSGLNNLFPFVTKIGRGQGKFGQGGGRGIEFTKQGRTALTLMATDMKGYLALQKQVNQAQNEFAARYATMLGTPGVKWEKLKSQLQALAIEFGTYLIPYMIKFAYYLDEGIQWVRAHQGMIKWIALGSAAFAMLNLVGGAIVTIGGAVQVIGALFAFAFGSSTLTGMAGVVAGLGKISAVLAVVTSAMYGLKEVWDNLWSKDFEGNTAQKWTRGIASFVKGAMTPLKIMPGPLGAAAKYNETIMDAILGSDTLTGSVSNKRKKRTKSGLEKTINEQVAAAIKAVKAAGNAGYNKKVTDAYMKAIGVDPAAMERWRASDSRDPAKQLAQAIKRNVQTVTQEVRSALETMYKELEQSNQTVMGSIFGGRWLNSDKFKYFEQFGIGPKMGDLIKDAQMQGADFATSQKVFNKLRKRGISEAFLQDLKNMGPEGFKYIKALLNGSDKQLKKYVAIINRNKKAVDEATKKDFKRKVADWQKHGGDLAEGLANGFDIKKGIMYDTITNAITHAFSGAIQKMAEVRAAAELTSTAVASLPGMSAIPTTANTKGLPGRKDGLPIGSVVFKYPTAPYTQQWGGYGNPGVMGRARGSAPWSNPFNPINTNPNNKRSLTSHSETNYYNISGFSPDEALRALEVKRAFRMKNRRR